ncbi:hypothetical protein [Mycobacterium sp. EPa45]|uniref:CDGP domain-containing protein n=1 Tax=Mycobacterium sp. EPa45 TaxID=1545728 RepID=UPI00069ADDDA|nr:hypothetical protein [Mycobacterium sp. EPa45]
MTTLKTPIGTDVVKRTLLVFAAFVGGLITMLPPVLLVTGALSVVEAQPPPNIPTDGCGGAVVFGNGGSQCDGPVQSDGSFQRCVSVYVLGIGGWNCFVVFPPPP